MANLENPQIEVTVFGSTDDLVISNDYHMEFDIEKDLSESPNTADLTIYNLDPDLRERLQTAEDQESPLEIKITPSGSTDLVSAYKGEIADVYTDWENPGHATYITCATGKANHRQFQFDAEFAQGTPKNEIIEKLITAVGLPTGNLSDFPTSGILFSHTFSGPAFKSLETFCFNHGLRAYITDGTTNIVSVYEPADFTVFVITPAMILGREPKITTRNDAQEIEQKTIVESIPEDPPTGYAARQTHTKKAWGSGLVVDYDGIDKLKSGLYIPLLAQPTINPDQIVSISNPDNLEIYKKFDSKYYRTQSTNHRGNNRNFSDWSTFLNVDNYEDTGGNILAL